MTNATNPDNHGLDGAGELDFPEGFAPIRFGNSVCMVPEFLVPAADQQFAGYRRVLESQAHAAEGGVSDSAKFCSFFVLGRPPDTGMFSCPFDFAGHLITRLLTLYKSQMIDVKAGSHINTVPRQFYSSAGPAEFTLFGTFPQSYDCLQVTDP
jgi:hypothetical protein